MQTSKTFSIHFRMNMGKIKGDFAPIYARITVNGKRAEISLKRDISVTYWDNSSKRAKPMTPGSQMLNSYLDEVYGNLLDSHNNTMMDLLQLIVK